MQHKLAELIDAEKTQETLARFRDAVGISAAIIDLQGNVTTSWQRICTDFHGVNPTACKRCIESDTMLANELMQGKRFSLHRCHNGLTDAASPIIIEGEHLANAFIGQFLTEKPDPDFFSLRAEQYGFNKSDYFQALSQVPILDPEALPPLLLFLTSFAEMTARLGLRQLRQLKTEKELRRARLKLEVQNQELHASQEVLNRAQAVANTGNWRLDARHNVLSWSDQTYRIFSILIGSPLTYEAFLAKVHLEDRKMVDRSWQAALYGGPYNTYEVVCFDSCRVSHIDI